MKKPPDRSLLCRNGLHLKAKFYKQNVNGENFCSACAAEASKRYRVGRKARPDGRFGKWLGKAFIAQPNGRGLLMDWFPNATATVLSRVQFIRARGQSYVHAYLTKEHIGVLVPTHRSHGTIQVVKHATLGECLLFEVPRPDPKRSAADNRAIRVIMEMFGFNTTDFVIDPVGQAKAKAHRRLWKDAVIDPFREGGNPGDLIEPTAYAKRDEE